MGGAGGGANLQLNTPPRRFGLSQRHFTIWIVRGWFMYIFIDLSTIGIFSMTVLLTLHSAVFLCSFLGKTSALRFFMHLLENILMIDNMLLRVSKKCHIFFKINFYILNRSVLWKKYIRFNFFFKIIFSSYLNDIQ